MSPIDNKLLVPRQEPLLLDYAPGAAAAYSLRKLSLSYSGPVVTVRRSSDDAEADFTAAEIDDGTLLGWVGAGVSGYVKTWHSQTGSSDATQSTAASQPKIVSAGAVITDGGSPAIRFDGTNDYLDATTVFVSQPDTVFAVLNRVSGAGNHLFDGITTRQVLSINGSLQDNMFAGTSLPGASASVFGEQVLYSVLFNGASSSAYRDGVQSISGNAGTNALNGLRISAFTPTSANLNGTMQELIIYPSDMTAQRQ